MGNQVLWIQKAAVLGSGVMGAQIAAHLVHAGIAVLLLDLPAPTGPDRNALVLKNLHQLKKLKPDPFASSEMASRITVGNYQDHLNDLRDCDCVIEVIAENMAWKKELYETIHPYLSARAILVTNTSGLSIQTLSEKLPQPLKSRFCGVHFFNPPRYQRLVELIPQSDTDLKLLDQLETFLVTRLGKGVVRAKDTPNFIANRIGVFAMLSTLKHTLDLGLPFDTVDALTGVLIGRSKSATYRTMDIVGLDTLLHVIRTLESLGDRDPWLTALGVLKPEAHDGPNLIAGLIQKGALGQKTGAGFYQKKGSERWVWEVKTQSYVAATGVVDPEVGLILKENNIHTRFLKLRASQHPQAKLLWACFRDLFHYVIYHFAEIAHRVDEIDCAMRWGFAWQMGPFEWMDQIGFSEVVAWIEADRAQALTLGSVALPAWALSAHTSKLALYTPKGSLCAPQNGETSTPFTFQYDTGFHLPVYRRQWGLNRDSSRTVILENTGAVVWLLEPGIAVFSFKTKMNIINQAVVDLLDEALVYITQGGGPHAIGGLILYQTQGEHFSAGADLKGFLEKAQQGDQAVDQMLAQFQQVCLKLKSAPFPVVAAVKGMALGGGCEVLLHAHVVVAALESYIGLVEAGVGVVPAGGGLKEMAQRAEAADKHQHYAALERFYKTIATATVSTSAYDAQDKGYLRSTDVIIMNAEEILHVARLEVVARMGAMACSQRSHIIRVLGRSAAANLTGLAVNLKAGQMISDHDERIAFQIAEILTGGELDEWTEIPVAWVLQKEREAFVALLKTAQTQARVQHLLSTGQALRN